MGRREHGSCPFQGVKDLPEHASDCGSSLLTIRDPLIHGGLISSSTAGLAAFVRIGSLDRLFANGEYCFQFFFCGFEKLRPIHCRNYGSRLYSWAQDHGTVMAKTDKSWEQWGSTDPYFGVLSSEEYRAANLSEESKLKFFRSGEDHINRVLDVIRHHVDRDFRPHNSLDFGCGVGRALFPLAKISDAAVGLDVSESMLAECRRNCQILGLNNVRLLKSDDKLSGLAGDFDFIHSYIVFQHIPVRRGEQLCALLLGHLRPGGVAAMQFYYHCSASRLLRALVRIRYRVPLANHIRNLLKGHRLSEPPMELHIYDVGRLATLFYHSNIINIFLELSQCGEFASVTIYGKK